MTSGPSLITLPLSLPVPQSRDTTVCRTLGTSEKRVRPPQSWWVGQTPWPSSLMIPEPTSTFPRVREAKTLGDLRASCLLTSLHPQGPWSLHGTVWLGPHPSVLPSQNPPCLESWSPPPTETAPLPLEWEFSCFQTSRVLDNWATTAKVICVAHVLIHV